MTNLLYGKQLANALGKVRRVGCVSGWSHGHERLHESMKFNMQFVSRRYAQYLNVNVRSIYFYIVLDSM